MLLKTDKVVYLWFKQHLNRLHRIIHHLKLFYTDFHTIYIPNLLKNSLNIKPYRFNHFKLNATKHITFKCDLEKKEVNNKKLNLNRYIQTIIQPLNWTELQTHRTEWVINLTIHRRFVASPMEKIATWLIKPQEKQRRWYNNQILLRF